MNRLTEIIHVLLLSFYHGCLMKDGWSTFDDSDDCVVKYKFSTWKRGISMPKEIEDYLKRKGVDHLVTGTLFNEIHLTLKRLSDGKKTTFHLIDFFIDHRAGSRSLFVKIGFFAHEPKLNVVHGFFMRQKEYERLAEFLKGGGVEFELDKPPWLEEVPMPVKAKPSSERPGKESAHYFGFI